MALLRDAAFWYGCGFGVVITIAAAYAVNVWINTAFTPKRGL